MRSRTGWATAGVLLAALVALVVVALFTRGGSAPTRRAIADGRPIVATASVVPQSHLFGERLRVRVDALVDRRRLDPARVVLDVGWTPYQPTEPMVRARQDVGRFTRLHWGVQLYCVVLDCTPRAGSIARFSFEPATLHYRGRPLRGDAPEPITIQWPSISAVSRLDPIDLERRAVVSRLRAQGQLQRTIAPPWRVSAANLDPISYSVRPGVLFWTALAGALLLVAASGAILRPYLPHVRRPHRAGPNALERALEAVERTRGRGDLAAERKALELLARELHHSGQRGLAWDASVLAWSEPVPEPELTGALAIDVRRTIAGRENGHG